MAVPDSVMADYDAIIRLEPTAAHYVLRGDGWASRKNLAEALADYLRANMLQPGSANAKIASIYEALVQDRKAKGNIDVAIALLTEALEKDPDVSTQVVLLKERAALWKEKREPDRAIADLSKAIDAKPSDPELLPLYKERIAIRAEQGDLNAALTDLAEAEKLKLGDSDRAALFESRLTLLAKADPDRALLELSKLIDAKPAGATLSKLHSKRADLWIAKGNLEGATYDRDQAITAAIEAAMTGSDLAALYQARAQLRKDRNRLDDAIADLGAAIKAVAAAPWLTRGQAASSAPIALALFQERAVLAKRKGDRDLEIADLTEILNRTPKEQTAERVRIYVELAGLRRAKNDLDGAIAALTEAAGIDPGNIDLLFLRVDMLKAKGALPEAENLLRRILAQPADDALHEKARAALAGLHSPAPSQQPAPSQPAPAKLAEVAAPPPSSPPAQVAPALTVPAPQLAAVPSTPKPAASPTLQPPIDLGRRVALVIGNSSYRHVGALSNPVVDSRSMRDVLVNLKFQVVYGEDLDKSAMEQRIGEFATLVRDADVALVYFAGHGSTFGDIPYVVPVDARYRSLEQVPYELVQIEMLVGELRRAKGIRIAILDACRDNEAEADLKRREVQKRGGVLSRGLGKLANVEGLIVAYATQHLTTADDGVPGRNSPFTASLVANIATPGLDVTAMFRKVGREVLDKTRGRQRPEISISLYDDYVLVPAQSSKPEARQGAR